MNKPKKLHLEALRILAVYLVVMHHTGTRGVVYYTTLAPSLGRYLAMLIPMLCATCVPTFYMISGVTMLGKDETPGQIWRRRIGRYAVVLVVASLMMYVYYGLRDNLPMSVGDFLKSLYRRNMIIPYWYLYSYLGFLILLPLLRKMIRNLSDREMIYLFLVHLAFNGIIPILQYRLSQGSVYLNVSLNVTIVTGNLVIFPAAGWFFEKKQLSWKQIGLLWAATAVAIAAEIYITDYMIRLKNLQGEGDVGTFYQSLCLVPTVTLYATFKKLFDGRTPPRWLERAILSVGSCTFGIYLIEQIVREEGSRIRERMIQLMPDVPAIMLYVLMVTTVCFGIIWIIKRIPGVKKFI